MEKRRVSLCLLGGAKTKIKLFAVLIFAALLLRAVSLVGLAAEISAFSHGSRSGNEICLTFDDGPHPRYTARILDLLKKYNIKATFFVIGNNVSQYPDMAKRIHEEGHEIGSHTFSHPHMLQLDTEALKKELIKTEEILASLGIPKPALFRPPEGYRTPLQTCLVKEMGYKMIVWSLDTHDWQGISSKNILSYTLKTVRGGDIILFHDYTSKENTTIAALEKLIPTLLKNGYHFITVSEMVG